MSRPPGRTATRVLAVLAILATCAALATVIYGQGR